MIGIYKITNKQTGKTYIGQATNIERRLSEHKQARYVPIDMWINMLGQDAFTYDVLEECSEDNLNEREQYYIQQYDSINTGYNKQMGGYNNSIGSGNGRSKLTETDVINIRLAYANHESPSMVYEKYKDKISKSQFQGTWQGRSWTHIMPEVFTQENKNYYIKELSKDTAAFTKAEILKYRQYYVTHTANETYALMTQEKGKIVKLNTFKRILSGDVRSNSFYKEIPIYSKTRKQWELNGEPVSTISESGE